MYPNFSEFGLYRYDSNGKQRSKNGRLFSSIIVYSILAMTMIFGGLLYVFVSGRFSDADNFRISNSTQKQTESSNNNAINNSTKNSDKFKNVIDSKGGLEVIEISGKNYSESHAKRIKRLDSEDESSDASSPETQKLIFFPNRTLKPPRIAKKPKVVQYPSLPPNHKISSRRIDPRIYQYATIQPKPHEFLRPPTPRSLYLNSANSIQDLISQNNQFHSQSFQSIPHLMASASDVIETRPIKLAGSYRHPRTNGNLAQIFQQAKPQTLKAEASDPFQNFKPASPQQINDILNNPDNNEHTKYVSMTTSDPPYFRRKFKQKQPSLPNYNVMHTSGGPNVLQTVKKRVQDRNEIQQVGKPFSVMLDVYPMNGDENDFAPSFMHAPNMRRIKPILNRYYQDPQMFNTINYPQLTARYPAYFRYQNNPRLLQQASTSYGAIQNNGMLKPSQLVVHLNLYPKNNSPTFKRSSSENASGVRQSQNEFQRPSRIISSGKRNKNQTIDVATTPFNINFNVHTGNGHPENIAHQKQLEFNRTSTEATVPQNNYFYEDDDVDGDDSSANQSFNVHPSVVYKEIYRDRPIHLMLKNTTTNTTRRPRNISNKKKYEKYDKSKKLKFHYQTIERPKETKYSSVIRPKTIGPFYK